MMYLLPHFEVYGKAPVWSEWMVSARSPIWIKMSSCRLISVGTFSVPGSIFIWCSSLAVIFPNAFCLVDLTPCCCPFIWLFCVSFDLGKCLFVSAVVRPTTWHRCQHGWHQGKFLLLEIPWLHGSRAMSGGCWVDQTLHRLLRWLAGCLFLFELWSRYLHRDQVSRVLWICIMVQL